jgi:alkylhydroperoxidase family enzyme
MSHQLRLSPIDEPTSLMMRAMYGYSQRTFGKVLMPMKVIYARVPALAALAQKIIKTHEKLSIEPELRFLVKVKVSQLNGCPFCEDISLAGAVQKNIGVERFRHLDEYSTSNVFTPREKAALAFATEATLHRNVSEETWQGVREQFSETEIVELTWLNAAENYFNLQAGILGIGSDNLAIKESV